MEEELIYDWNLKDAHSNLGRWPIVLFDETLRDGVQSPSVADPDLDQKFELVRLMAGMGIGAIDLGLPGAGPRAKEHVLELVRMIRDEKLPIIPCTAARTLVQDIAPIADIQQTLGFPMEVYAFIGSSPVRQYTEGWTVESIAKTSRKAIEFAVGEGLVVCYVTEDTTRSRPDQLRVLFDNAIDAGASRLVLCDTCGHATPNGVKQLVRFARSFLEAMDSDVGLDWHGHNDRGFGLANALFALEAGVTRVHGTALGVGERVGNTPIDQLLVNLKLLGHWDHDLSGLNRFVHLASEACGVPLPYNYPVFGDDAFRTATGVHAAAIIKALDRGDEILADLVYSGVPATAFGQSQVIEIGPMSGKSNVRYWLKRRGHTNNDALEDAIFEAAKSSPTILTEAQLSEIVSNASV
ncbi:MAG: LeuA family protein [Myxococcota bacterium]|nr:LeuA family protein [Myxococcota bacterium]